MNSLFLPPFGHGASPSGEAWDACAACVFSRQAGALLFLLPFGHAVSPSGEAWDACAARVFSRQAGALLFLLPFGHTVSPSGEAWDACAACGKVGPVMGLRPLRGPPCIPPEAPPKKVFNFLGATRATRLKLRELPSLAPLAQAISLRDA